MITTLPRDLTRLYRVFFVGNTFPNFGTILLKLKLTAAGENKKPTCTTFPIIAARKVTPKIGRSKDAISAEADFKSIPNSSVLKSVRCAKS